MASLTIKGNWIAATPIPDQTLESRETRLKGKDKELLLILARKILRWLPEERLSAQDLYEDEFLTQFVPKDQPGASSAPKSSLCCGETALRACQGCPVMR